MTSEALTCKDCRQVTNGDCGKHDSEYRPARIAPKLVGEFVALPREQLGTLRTENAALRRDLGDAVDLLGTTTESQHWTGGILLANVNTAKIKAWTRAISARWGLE